MKTVKRWLLLSCTIFFTAHVSGETLLNYRVSGVANIQNSVQQFYINGTKLRTAYTGNSYYLFDSASNNLWMVDRSRQTYYLIKHSLISDSLKVIDQQREKLKALLQSDNLPEAARKNLQTALASFDQVEANSRELTQRRQTSHQLKPTGKKSTHNGQACDVYQVSGANGEAEVCYGRAQLPSTVIETFNRYQQYLGKISGVNAYFALVRGLLPLKAKHMGSPASLQLQSATDTRKGSGFYAIPQSFSSAAAQPNGSSIIR